MLSFLIEGLGFNRTVFRIGPPEPYSNEEGPYNYTTEVALIRLNKGKLALNPKPPKPP